MTEKMHMMVETTRKAVESKPSANWVHATPKAPIGYAVEVQGQTCASAFESCWTWSSNKKRERDVPADQV